METISKESLEVFVKENLFCTVEELSKRLENAFGIKREDIKYEYVNGSMTVTINTGVNKINLTVEVE